MGEGQGWPGPPTDDDRAEMARRVGSESFRAYTRRRGERKAEELIAAEDKRDRPPMVIRSGAWLNAQQFPPVDFAVPEIGPAGVIFIGGAPKGGKSWLSQALSLGWSSGSWLLGCLPAGVVRPVLYLALEDSDQRIKDRSTQLGYEQVPEAFWYTIDCHPGAVIDEVAAFLAHWRDWRPVVIIDTWGKITTPALRGETTFDRDYRLSTGLQQLAKSVPGSVVIINCHTRKAGADDFVDAVSGTRGVTAGADSIWILERKRGETQATLSITGRDVAMEDTFTITGMPRWELSGGSLESAAAMAHNVSQRSGLSDRSNAIMDLLMARGRMSTTAIAEAVGVSVQTASTYLGRLTAGGRIRKSGRGEWEPWSGEVNTLNGHGDYDWRAMHRSTFPGW